MPVHDVFDWQPRRTSDYPHFLQAIEAIQRNEHSAFSGDKRPNHLRADGRDKVTAYGHATCPKCAQPILLLFNSSTHNLHLLKKADPQSALAASMFAREYIELLGTIPAATEYSVPDDLPEVVQVLWPATQLSLDRGDPPSRIVSECRSILDVCLKELGETKGLRKSRIGNLKDRFLITEDIASWANELWDDGNDAIHDIQANAEDAKQHVEFLKLFFRVVFELPKEVKRKQSS
ncbi:MULTISPECIES: DUF4145 domain-containing protein [Phaeobacter]|uniref:DUF4145 domain-containing protein n=1 Tax=Phaeobacter TaxID=302485 RepID=UPI00058E87DA|nr:MULTISPECIES: DUF4145 domain-containing protein [Phaeobacter]KII12594.1 hypothetical protein OO25_17055 [Phaeobacter sp. S60]